jgi:hypothetical protein
VWIERSLRKWLVQVREGGKSALLRGDSSLTSASKILPRSLSGYPKKIVV